MQQGRSLQPMSFRASESLAEQIARHLAAEIITGQLAPKDRIQELRVAGELGVSRGSVREALLVLQRRHLISIIPRRGAVVTELSAPHVDALFEMMEALYSMLAIRVAAVWDEDDLEPLMDLFGKMREYTLLDQTEAFFKACVEFPRIAYAYVQNPFLEQTLEDLMPAMGRVHFRILRVRPEEISKSLAFFAGILDGMMNRDAVQIERTVHDWCVHHRDLALATLDL